MAHLHCQRRTRVQTRIRIPNTTATLYYAEHVHVAQTRTRILLFLLSTGIRVPVSTRVVSGNVNEPLEQKRNLYLI